MSYEIFGVQIYAVFNLILAVSVFIAIAESIMDWTKKLGYYDLVLKLVVRVIRNLGLCLAITIIAILLEMHYVKNWSIE